LSICNTVVLIQSSMKKMCIKLSSQSNDVKLMLHVFKMPCSSPEIYHVQSEAAFEIPIRYNRIILQLRYAFVYCIWIDLFNFICVRKHLIGSSCIVQMNLAADTNLCDQKRTCPPKNGGTSDSKCVCVVKAILFYCIFNKRMPYSNSAVPVSN